MILQDLHEGAGAVFGTVRAVERPLHYGDTAGEYEAAVDGAAVIDRSERRWLRVTGRDPRGMLSGMITGRVPPLTIPLRPEVDRGTAEPSALLDAKGKMLAELRVFPGPAPEETLLIELAPEAMAAATDHFRKFLPPRFATFADASEATSLLTVLGPRAAALVSREALGMRAPPEELETLDEGELLRVSLGSGGTLSVVRNRQVASPAWDLIGDVTGAKALWRVLVDAGARPIGAAVWETLRIEAGRPEYGADMDASTIPIEAGIQQRMVDYSKGCFTGQEVLIRIRDRGHVNRHLRGLRMGRLPTLPQPGTELFREQGKAVGRVTSAALSPRFGEAIALGFVRREVEPPAELRLGSPDGPVVRVHDLEADWRP